MGVICSAKQDSFRHSPAWLTQITESTVGFGLIELIGRPVAAPKAGDRFLAFPWYPYPAGEVRAGFLSSRPASERSEADRDGNNNIPI